MIAEVNDGKLPVELPLRAVSCQHNNTALQPPVLPTPSFFPCTKRSGFRPNGSSVACSTHSDGTLSYGQHQGVPYFLSSVSPVSPTHSPYSDPEIRSNILKSLLLNILSLTSIYTFDLILQPLVHNHPSWWHRNVGWFYRVLWLLPVVGVSFYLNVSTIPLCDVAVLMWHPSRVHGATRSPNARFCCSMGIAHHNSNL